MVPVFCSLPSLSECEGQGKRRRGVPGVTPLTQLLCPPQETVRVTDSRERETCAALHSQTSPHAPPALPPARLQSLNINQRIPHNSYSTYHTTTSFILHTQLDVAGLSSDENLSLGRSPLAWPLVSVLLLPQQVHQDTPSLPYPHQNIHHKEKTVIRSSFGPFR